MSDRSHHSKWLYQWYKADTSYGTYENETKFRGFQFSHSVVSDSVTPWTAACQASPSITNSQSLLKLMSIESEIPSNHLILCGSLLLLPSIFPRIRVFSSESVLRIRWPKYWSFSFSMGPSNEYSGLISFIHGLWSIGGIFMESSDIVARWSVFPSGVLIETLRVCWWCGRTSGRRDRVETPPFVLASGIFLFQGLLRDHVNVAMCTISHLVAEKTHVPLGELPFQWGHELMVYLACCGFNVS